MKNRILDKDNTIIIWYYCNSNATEMIVRIYVLDKYIYIKCKQCWLMVKITLENIIQD
jgi:hypothetical protein